MPVDAGAEGEGFPDAAAIWAADASCRIVRVGEKMAGRARVPVVRERVMRARSCILMVWFGGECRLAGVVVSRVS